MAALESLVLQCVGTSDWCEVQRETRTDRDAARDDSMDVDTVVNIRDNWNM